jgi:hypothetical protein
MPTPRITVKKETEGHVHRCPVCMKFWRCYKSPEHAKWEMPCYCPDCTREMQERKAIEATMPRKVALKPKPKPKPKFKGRVWRNPT